MFILNKQAALKVTLRNYITITSFWINQKLIEYLTIKYFIWSIKFLISNRPNKMLQYHNIITLYHLIKIS